MKQTSSVKVKITVFPYNRRHKSTVSEIDMPYSKADEMTFEMLNSGIAGADAFSRCLREFHFPISGKTLSFMQEEFPNLALTNSLNSHLEGNDDLEGTVSLYFPNPVSM
ncbi:MULTISPECIES: hypothetical protein [unclassified Ruegeria]|uniref:hypothetical protein n=1 Tax=unclassified Ruegeria TaxID=2625375 RepID=UPI001489301E|nr:MULTISPECIES: hypothetical protein [unclassified Ruegeria]